MLWQVKYNRFEKKSEISNSIQDGTEGGAKWRGKVKPDFHKKDNSNNSNNYNNSNNNKNNNNNNNKVLPDYLQHWGFHLEAPSAFWNLVRPMHPPVDRHNLLK